MEYLELLSVVQDTTAKEALEMKMEGMQAAFELSERENKNKALNNENKKRKQKDHTVYQTGFDPIPEQKKEIRQYIPPQSHPWKLESFKRYLRSIGKTLEEYEAERAA